MKVPRSMESQSDFSKEVNLPCALERMDYNDGARNLVVVLGREAVAKKEVMVDSSPAVLDKLVTMIELPVTIVELPVTIVELPVTIVEVLVPIIEVLENSMGTGLGRWCDP